MALWAQRGAAHVCVCVLLYSCEALAHAAHVMYMFAMDWCDRSSCGVPSCLVRLMLVVFPRAG
eukprot:829578-Prymnesium_polylepis.2